MPHDPRPESPESPLRESWSYADANRLFVRRPLEPELAYAEVEVGPASNAHERPRQTLYLPSDSLREL